MRRGINIRKKKKIISKQINNKSLKLLLSLTALLIICAIIYHSFIQNIFIKEKLKKDNLIFSNLNQDIPFSLNKIILFSSVTAQTGSINNLLSLNLSNYCDIGIYLNKLQDENILISSLYIDNISISAPEIGTPCLYAKNINDFGKNSFTKTNIINNRFDFDIITSNNTINYNKTEIYNNGTTPITIGFYNENIKTNFIPDNPEIITDGTLLKLTAIPLTSLNCTISFTINIITNSSEHYICNTNINIPFKNKETSIYDSGYITKEILSNELNNFIRIK